MHHAAPPTPTLSGAFTLDEVAEMLRVSRRFLHLEIQRGKLRVIHLSKKATRVRPKDLENYLNSAA